MLLLATKTGTVGVLLVAAVMASAVDAAWATPVNTFLLICLVMAGWLTSRKISTVQAQTEANHAVGIRAAEAGASAAEAAALAAQQTTDMARRIQSQTTGLPSKTEEIKSNTEEILKATKDHH